MKNYVKIYDNKTPKAIYFFNCAAEMMLYGARLEKWQSSYQKFCPPPLEKSSYAYASLT